MLRAETKSYIDALPNDMLVAYVTAGAESYEQEALDYAAQALRDRNLSIEETKQIGTAARSEAATKEAYRTEGLGTLGKSIAFISGLVGFGFLLIFAIAGIRYRLQGRSGKIEDMWRWYFRGLAVLLTIGAIRYVIYLIAWSTHGAN